ncbi:MAG: DUF305 domain-containing protein, partial [Acidobacteriota bacterium]|nr:DUF305 domain-containing protein [Acidobacteriota bacterium]
MKILTTNGYLIDPTTNRNNRANLLIENEKIAGLLNQNQSAPPEAESFGATGFKQLTRILLAALRNGSVISAALLCFFSLPVSAQQAAKEKPPVIVQPGAPGQPTRVLPPATKAILPPRSTKDAEFMQGMIMHHGQAVEMTALIEARTDDKEVRLLGSRISHTQTEEINFMKRWLAARGEKTSMPMSEMSKMEMPGMDMADHHQMLMPGMLTSKQMEELKNAKSAEFDRLFLNGMIQHHTGALVMVKELFNTGGAGQDAEIFNFATDVDSGQRAEIR